MENFILIMYLRESFPSHGAISFNHSLLALYLLMAFVNPAVP